MIFVSSLVVGFLSAVLISVGANLVTFPDAADEASRQALPPLQFFVFLFGWVITMAIVMTRARSASHVWARGSLIGSVEWLLLGLAVMIFSSRADRVDAMGALVSMSGLIVAFAMTLVCLILYVIASRIGVEFAHDEAGRLCPFCAEPIKAAARICRFCGKKLEGRSL